MGNPVIFLIMIAEEFSQNILPFPILYVGTALKKAGYEVIIRHISEEQIDLTVDEICDSKPIMVGFSVLTGLATLKSALMSQKIKDRVDIPVVWGGVHPSLLPEQCVSERYVDFVVIGEAEESAVELANSLNNKIDFSKIAGLAFKDICGNVFINRGERHPVDFEKYGIDYSLIHIDKYITNEEITVGGKKIKVRSLGYCASRGCPHNCAFCYNLKFNRRRWRAPSAEFVIADILRLKKEYGITKIHFWDDNFFVDQDRAFKILSGIDLYSGIDLRIDYITAEIAQRLVKLKVVFLIFGVESGSDRLLTLMNKGFERESIIKVSKILGELHIDALYSAILSLPTEKKEELDQTVDMLLEIKRYHKEATFTVGMYLPYPGTDMYELAKKEGFIPPAKTKDWNELDRWRNIAPIPWADKKVCLHIRHLFYFLSSKSGIVKFWAFQRLKHKILRFSLDIKLHILMSLLAHKLRALYGCISIPDSKNSLKGRIYRYLCVKSIFFINSISCLRRDRSIDDVKNVKKILIIHPQMAGDNVVLTPAIRNLAIKFKHSEIYLLTKKYSAGILHGNPYIKDFIYYEDKAVSGYVEWFKLIARLRRERFDLTIDTQVQFSNMRRSLLPFLTGAHYRLGYVRSKGFRGVLNTHESKLNTAEHGARHFMDLVKALSVEIVNDHFEVYYTKKDDDMVSEILRSCGISEDDIIIGIHAGNVDKVKLWRADRFASLADRLSNEFNARIIFTGGAEDIPYINLITKELKCSYSVLAGRFTFPQFAALIARMDLLVSIDTVSVHIAAATNTPTVGIYGKTYVYRWLPWNKQKQMFVTGYHRCAACWLGNYFDIIVPTSVGSNVCNYNFSCIRNISVEDVLKASEVLLMQHGGKAEQSAPRNA